MSRSRRAADRIRKEVPLAQVLFDYGYDVEPRVSDREQQFSCDLHGDGSDGKPSARYYPGGGQFFCFACGRSRDAIELVREKEGVQFWEAIKVHENRYKLPALPWQPGDDDRPPTIKQQVEKALKASETPERALSRLERFLSSTTQDRSLPPERCAALWEGFDRVTIYWKEGGDPSKAVDMSQRILSKVKEELGILTAE